MTTTPLTDQQLADIRAREAAATRGPWSTARDAGYAEEYGETFVANWSGEYMLGVGDISLGVGEEAEADLAFVLGARTDVPALLAELDRVRAERDGFADRVDTLTAVVKSNKLAHRIAVEECDRLTAELDRVRAELTRRRTDDLTIRGALAPADGPRHVPMALGDSVTPAVEWLIADRNRVTVELEQARQQTAAVLALGFASEDELEQMDPEQYHHASGYGDAIAEVHRLLAAQPTT